MKKLLSIALAVALLLSFGIFALGCGDSGESADTENKKAETNTQTENIEYEVFTVSQLVDDLDANALKAEKKYQDKYVEITGRLSNIDSDGDYISLSPTNDDFCFTTVQCYIKNEEQESQVMELSIDDTVTVKGKITSVGEIMGYSLNIDSIN